MARVRWTLRIVGAARGYPVRGLLNVIIIEMKYPRMSMISLVE
jgi:hypothetical protein